MLLQKTFPPPPPSSGRTGPDQKEGLVFCNCLQSATVFCYKSPPPPHPHIQAERVQTKKRGWCFVTVFRAPRCFVTKDPPPPSSGRTGPDQKEGGGSFVTVFRVPQCFCTPPPHFLHNTFWCLVDFKHFSSPNEHTTQFQVFDPLHHGSLLAETKKGKGKKSGILSD